MLHNRTSILLANVKNMNVKRYKQVRIPQAGRFRYKDFVFILCEELSMHVFLFADSYEFKIFLHMCISKFSNTCTHYTTHKKIRGATHSGQLVKIIQHTLLDKNAFMYIIVNITYVINILHNNISQKLKHIKILQFKKLLLGTTLNNFVCDLLQMVILNNLCSLHR